MKTNETKTVFCPVYHSFKLSIDKFRSGNYQARPAGQLGNVGNHPFLWVAVAGTSPSNAAERFYNVHSEDLENWQYKKLAESKEKEAKDA